MILSADSCDDCEFLTRYNIAAIYYLVDSRLYGMPSKGK